MNYNSYLRKYVRYLCKCVEQEMNDANLRVDSDYIKGMYFANLFSTNMDSFIDKIFGNNELSRLVNAENKMQIDMLLMILVTDLFVSLSSKYVMGSLNSTEENLYNRIVKAINEDSYNFLVCDLKSIGYFVKATNDFDNMSAYDKVLMIKSLEEENRELLNKLNPFFIEEYNKLNVNVDRIFIMRQIVKWINGTGDAVHAIEETAIFLSKLFNISDDNIEVVTDIMNAHNPDEVTQAFIDEDINQIAGYISSYYEAYKDEFLTKKE